MASTSIGQSAIRKIYWRLLPLAMVTYLLCYVDRINVGFAALTMRGDLHMSATQFGFASGIFFWGYFIFEVPSNVILEKVGARLWIARIMISWGLLAAATAFVTGPTSFAVLRFVLGVAEAGFMPGLLLYFTYWLPGNHQARIVAGFLVALPIAVALGAPISTALLSLDGLWGLKGWQCMYIFEAIPTVLIGVAVLVFVTDRPERARWLTTAEQKWLIGSLAAERREIESESKVSLWRSFWDPRVALLSLNYLGIVAASLGMLLFLPQIVKQLGVSNMAVGWVTMIPYGCGAVSMVFFGWLSDRLGDRRWCLFWTCLISTGGLIIAGLTLGTWWSLVGMTIAAIGFYGTKGPFWSIPTMWLTGTAAASGIAWINSVGNLGGFFGPALVGWAKSVTGNFAGGLYALAVCALVSAIVSLLWIRVPRTVSTGAAAAAAAE